MYWHRKIVQTLTGKFPGGAEYLSGDEITWQELRDVLAQPSFFGPKLWVVRKAQVMFQEKDEIYVDFISRGNCLVMSLSVKDNPAPKGFLKNWSKVGGIIVQAGQVSFNDAFKWVSEKLTEDGYKITRDAAQALVLIAGRNIERLEKELEKLELFVGASGARNKRDGVVRQITVSAVLACVSPDPEMHTFSFIDAVADKNISKAFLELEDLRARGTNPILIISILASHFGLLWRVKECSLKGVPQNSLARVLGVHPYSAKKALKQSKKWTFSQLENAIRLLAELDESLKKGKMDFVLAMDYLLVKLSKSDGLKYQVT